MIHDLRLKTLMQQAGIPSFAALSRVAGVSEWQVTQLRQGRIETMRVERLIRLSQALQVSLPELLTSFAPASPPIQSETIANSPEKDDPATSLAVLQQEYHRLEQQLEQQRQALEAEFQRTSLQALESWMMQWPTAAYAAQQNPQAPAIRLLPLLKPVEQLLQNWGVEAIAPVGSELPYDPQFHQLMEGQAQPGELIRVRYTGYRQGDRLLFRARVSPVQDKVPTPPLS